MAEYDLTYLTRRLHEEQAAAERATDDAAKQVHTDLADAYRSKIADVLRLVEA